MSVSFLGARFDTNHNQFNVLHSLLFHAQGLVCSFHSLEGIAVSHRSGHTHKDTDVTKRVAVLVKVCVNTCQ